MGKLAMWALGALGVLVFSGPAAADGKDADRAQLQVSLDDRLNDASYAPYAVSGTGADQVIRPAGDGDLAAMKGGYVFREGVLRVPADKNDPPAVFIQISLSAKDDNPLRLSRLSLVSLRGDTNLKPMLTSDSALCNNTEPVLVFRNHGWGTADKASVSLRFTGAGSVNHRPIEFSIGDLADGFGLSIRDLLKSTGHDLDASLRSPCSLDATRPECAAALADEANADPLLGVVSNEYQQFSTTAAGTVRYEWTENGETKTASDEFEQPVTLGMDQQSGSGLGGDFAGEPSPMAPERVSIKTINVKLDKPPVKLPIDLRGNPSANQRVVSLKLVAPRSAKIEFAVLAKFKDGSEVQSDPVTIDYFRTRALAIGTCHR